MRSSPRKNGLDSLFKEVRVFKEGAESPEYPFRMLKKGDSSEDVMEVWKKGGEENLTNDTQDKFDHDKGQKSAISGCRLHWRLSTGFFALYPVFMCNLVR